LGCRWYFVELILINILEEIMYTQLSKAELTRLSKLNKRKHRDESGMFLAEGVRVVDQILRRGLIDVEMLIVEAGRESVLEQVFGAGPGRKWGACEVRVAAPDQLDRLADTEQSQGVVALCKAPVPVDVRDLVDMERGIILALDRIQDPGNMGALYRSAAWFGVIGVLAGGGTVDLFNPKVVRSTAGALGSVSMVRGELPEVIDALGVKGWEVVVMDAGGERLECGAVGWPERMILVVGNEANGVSSAIMNRAGKKISIHGNSDNVESLNVAVAASIGLFACSNLIRD
jgi:RNA methyltransferase, TrmH family